MMNNHMQALGFVLASSLAVSGVYATPWNGEPTPQAAQNNVAAVSDPQAQVTSEAQTVNATDNQVIVRSVQTASPQNGPKPSFDSLDTNHDGFISESEAEAYPLLANDYLHVARRGSRGVTRAEYDRW
jgi:hypothetical protein